MIKTKVGYSENVAEFASGVETAEMADTFDDKKLGLLFTSCAQDTKMILNGVKATVGKVPVIGCTSSAAVCTQDGYLNKESGYSAMMMFGGDLEVGVAGSEQTKDETPREVGRRIAKEAIKNHEGEKASYLFMCASPANEEEYLQGISDIIGDVPVFGGSAADNTVEGKWTIFNDEEVFADGCVIAVIYTDDKLVNLYTGAYNETKNVGVITKVKDERTLVEIDHEPALKKYAEWTNQNPDDIMGGNLLTATITAPLGVKDAIGRVTAVRHPMNGNDDYSMNIGANLEEGTAIMQLENSPEGILKANADTVAKLNEMGEFSSYFLVHCGGRRLGLQIAGIEDKIYPEIKKAIPDKEFLMVFTFGEYGRGDHSANTVGGLSLSFTGIGE